MKLHSGMIYSAVILMATIIVLFSAYANVVPTAQVAGDSLGDQAQCEGLGCYFNASATEECSLAEPNQTIACAGDYEGSKIPLSSLFAGGGIVFIIVMIALFLYIFKGSMGKVK